MSQPRFISADEGGHLRDEHLPEHAQEEVVLASVTDPATPLGRQIQQAQVAPHLVPIYHREEPKRNVRIQGDTARVAYAERYDGSPGRPFDKTTDGGLTWTRQGSVPFASTGYIKLASGTILSVQDIGHVNPSGNAKIARSTDDGATWSTIDAGLRFPPISQQGICEGTDGSVAVAEYGNLGNTVYRIRRSIDDGLTWTTVLETDGLEPTYDPGHIHSLTYDHIEKCHLAFVDRPDNSGFDGPRIYISRDNMATWDLLGTSVDWDHPNFVSPMYFQNYIAWGSDNQINGRISRMRRDHFYSGDWAGNTEHVHQSDQKAMYYTIPLRDDVWLVCTNIEHIKGAQDGRFGAYTMSVFVVDQDGARVSGGIDVPRPNLLEGIGPRVGGRIDFPSTPLGHTDYDGFAWLNVANRTMPVTQGWSPPTISYAAANDPLIVQGQTISVRSAEGVYTPVATASSDGIVFEAPLGIGESNQGVYFSGSSPEGELSARGGSICLCSGTTTPADVGLWVKETTAVGTTGWVKK